MILRLWRGWTAPGQTSVYRRLLTEEVAPAIMQRRIEGLTELAVLARDPAQLTTGAGGETLTVMTFDDAGAVAAFAGDHPSRSVVPPAGRRVLSRFDEHSRHYELLARYDSRS